MYDCKILADSISPESVRLTTFQITFPRFILAEVNTHRMLSRNSASSRAIPLAKQMAMLQSDPFVPENWPTEQKGMSGGEPLDEHFGTLASDEWEKALEDAMRHAQRLSERGVHKSLCNRLLEPFMWHTSIVSATDWDNFFALRCAPDAQPEFRVIALMMKETLESAIPLPLKYGEWHLPLVTKEELASKPAAYGKKPTIAIFKINWAYWRKVSAGRCARVSYLTHDGVRDPEKDIELHDRLVEGGHMSPTEHQGTPAEGKYTYCANFRAWMPYRKYIPNEGNFSKHLLAAA